MGFLQDVKSKLTKAVDSQGEKIGDGLDKAGDVVDEKTGGQHSAQIDGGVEQAKNALDGLDGQDDDIP